MAEMVTEVYDAFRSIGVEEDKAKTAAIALTGLKDESWKRSVEKELAGIRVDMADIRGTLRLHAWILGTNTAMLTALLFKVFTQ